MRKISLTVTVVMAVGAIAHAENVNIDNDDILTPVEPGVADIVVVPSKRTGPVKPMNAVNNVPIILGTGDNVYDWKADDSFRDLSVPMARTHDSRDMVPPPGRMNDVALIFPDFEADENDPKNYDFELTDLYLNSIRLQGSKIMYFLGSSWDGLKNYGTDAPPRDYAKWARIVEHVIRHYNEGWGWTNVRVSWSNQFNITHWEIWNEPDLDCTPEYWKTGARTWERRHRYWNGSPEEFFAFYRTAATYLKKTFPDLKFGGPGLAGRKDWAERFLAYCKTNAVPIDFFSWHKYGKDPLAYIESVREIRALLDRHGYTETSSVLNEWNYNTGWSRDEFRENIIRRSEMNNFRVAAFYASVMSMMQRQPVDMLMHYDMRPGLFNGVFSPGAELPQKAYFAFYAWSRLQRLGQTVSVRVSGSEECGLTAVAARNEAGDLALLVTRFAVDANESKKIPVRISVRGRALDGARLHLVDEIDRYTERVLHLDTEGAARIRLAPNAFAVIELADRS